MNIRTMHDKMLTNIMELVRPSFVQAAALCLRDTPKGREVVLVRTFQRRHWIIPKGWPIKNLSLAQAAAQEAWEEAGVRGHVGTAPIGAFTYTKIRKSGLPVQCRPQIFLLEVTEVHDRYPEATKRERQWVSLSRAANMVQNSQLSAFLRKL